MESPIRKVRVTCLRHTVDALNVLHLIIACLTIVGAIAVKAIFSQYTFPSFSSGFSALLHLPNLWIATAFFLALFSAFGIFATIRNSTKLLNLYAVAVTLVFVLQLVTAITGFALLPQGRRIVEGTLSSLMMRHEYYFQYRYTIDWIQRNYQCCGISGPEDWTVIPMSCCYIMREGECLSGYFKIGCHNFLYESLYKNLLLIAWSSVVIGLLHIWAIIAAYVLARRVRQSKTERDIKRWTSTNDVIIGTPTEKNE